MNTQRPKVYRLENIEIDVSRLSLKRDGEARHLRPQPFQVLIYLLEQRERVVTKKELMDRVWGDTAVGDNALEQCLAEIRRVIGDDSRQPRFIKTVPRVGYRFIGEVEEVNLPKEVASANSPKHFQADLSAASKQRQQPSQSWVIRRLLLVAIAIVLIGGVVTAIYLIQKWRARTMSLANVTLPETAGKRSVAVMFFDNQSGSADLDWLREGLADMLITGLSRSKKPDDTEPPTATHPAGSSRSAIFRKDFARRSARHRAKKQSHDCDHGQLCPAG